MAKQKIPNLLDLYFQNVKKETKKGIRNKPHTQIIIPEKNGQNKFK